MTYFRAILIACAVAGWGLATPEAAAQETQTTAAPNAQTWEINARDQDIQQSSRRSRRSPAGRS